MTRLYLSLMGKNYATNRHLLAEVKRRGVSVKALAEHLGLARQTVGGRLNTLDKPSEVWVVQVLDALDALEGGVPTV